MITLAQNVFVIVHALTKWSCSFGYNIVRVGDLFIWRTRNILFTSCAALGTIGSTTQH